MILLLALVGCGPKVPPPAAGDAPAPARVEAVDPAVVGVDSPLLRSLLADHWRSTMARYPEWATTLGFREHDAELFDPSEGARVAWLRRQQEWALRASALPDTSLSPRDRVTRDLLLEELRTSLATQRCRFAEWSVSARRNALVDANDLADDPRLDTPEDAAALLARYRALPDTIRAEIANLRAGLADGLVGNAESISRVIEMVEAELATPVGEATLSRPAPELRAVVEDGIRPALVEYLALLRDELLPAARTGGDVGLHALPGGAECYAALARESTTLDLSPDELHELGLEALEGIHAELRDLGEGTLGTRELPEIFERLRTDPALRFETSEQVLETAEGALDRARAAIPAWFGRLPAAACVVEPVPDYLAPYTTIAYYQPPRPDGSRPGTYFVNTSDPGTRPRFEAEVLAFHESIPGHHLQIAIAQELGDLPAFRRYGGVTAFVEGWALYTERLSDEMGLYTGDLDRMGVLSFDTWRAARLVVDTGIHHRGWSREQAVTFLLENTPLAPNNVDVEVDRYVTTPGQALAYKVGQLRIRDLRARAEEALGDRFDAREFHDVVLGSGPVTLPVLTENVRVWIERNTEAP